MIFVSDIFADVQQVIGTADSTTTYDKINRAIRLLRNKASASNVTWDPSLIYCNIATTSPTSCAKLNSSSVIEIVELVGTYPYL